MKIHRILSADPGCCGETLCHIPVTWVRDDVGALRWIISSKSRKRMKCVWTGGARDFDCSTCQIVWHNITRSGHL